MTANVAPVALDAVPESLVSTPTDALLDEASPAPAAAPDVTPASSPATTENVSSDVAATASDTLPFAFTERSSFKWPVDVRCTKKTDEVYFVNKIIHMGKELGVGCMVTNGKLRGLLSVIEVHKSSKKIKFGVTETNTGHMNLVLATKLTVMEDQSEAETQKVKELGIAALQKHTHHIHTPRVRTAKTSDDPVLGGVTTRSKVKLETRANDEEPSDEDRGTETVNQLNLEGVSAELAKLKKQLLLVKAQQQKEVQGSKSRKTTSARGASGGGSRKRKKPAKRRDGSDDETAEEQEQEEQEHAEEVQLHGPPKPKKQRHSGGSGSLLPSCSPMFGLGNLPPVVVAPTAVAATSHDQDIAMGAQLATMSMLSGVLSALQTHMSRSR